MNGALRGLWVAWRPPHQRAAIVVWPVPFWAGQKALGAMGPEAVGLAPGIFQRQSSMVGQLTGTWREGQIV